MASDFTTTFAFEGSTDPAIPDPLLLFSFLHCRRQGVEMFLCSHQQIASPYFGAKKCLMILSQPALPSQQPEEGPLCRGLIFLGKQRIKWLKVGGFFYCLGKWTFFSCFFFSFLSNNTATTCILSTLQHSNYPSSTGRAPALLMTGGNCWEGRQRLEGDCGQWEGDAAASPPGQS